MGQPIKDESGKTYGYWKVICFHDVKYGNARWLCKCTNCGDCHPVYGFTLRSGRSKHCRKCNNKGLD